MTTKVNIFERASRTGLRFASVAGNLSVEDLWHVPLTSKVGNVNLNDIARGCNLTLKSQEEESFVDVPAKKNIAIQLAFDIVKHVIAVRIEERDIAKATTEKAKVKQVLIDALAASQNRELGAKSPEELQIMINEL